MVGRVWAGNVSSLLEPLLLGVLCMLQNKTKTSRRILKKAICFSTAEVLLQELKSETQTFCFFSTLKILILLPV